MTLFVTLTCDGQGCESAILADTAKEANDKAHEDAWQFKPGGYHYCPLCKGRK